METSRKRLCIGISLLAGAMGVVLGMVLALNGLTATIGQKMALLLCTLVLWGAGAAVLLQWDLLGKVEYTALGLLMLLLGLCLRMALLDYMSPDYNTFLSQWVATMKGMTVREALTTPIGDYNMPYLYLLLMISRLPIRDLYGIKLFSILADVASALAVAALVRYLTKKDGAALLAFLAALFCPTTWLNSGYWGQCDSVYGALGLWALYAGLQKRSKTCYLLFALSLSFKLQAVFLLPMAAVLLGCGKIRLKDVWAFPVGFVGASLPALLAGRSLSNTFSIYFSQTQSYPYLSLNAPSFWSLIDNNYFSNMAGAPVLIAMSLSLGLLLLALWHGDRLDDRGLLLLGLVFSLMIPWLLPRMHERYFYFAELLSLVYGAMYPRKIAVPAILMTGGFLVYSQYLFGGAPILSLRLVAAIYGALLLYLLWQLMMRLKTKTKTGGNEYGISME